MSMPDQPVSTDPSTAPLAAPAPAAPASAEGAGLVAPLLVLGATAALAFKGIVAKLAYAAGIDVAGILLLRFGLAVPLFWLVYRLFLRPSGQRPLAWRDILLCLPTGVLFAIATEADFRALSILDAGTSRLILFTYPAVILLSMAVLERRMPSVRTLGLMAVTYAGLLLVLRPAAADVAGPVFWTGVAWAFTSAVSYAVFLVASRPVMRRTGSARFTVLSNTITFLIVIPFGLWEGVPEVPTLEGFLWAAVIAAVCTVLPFFLLNEGVRRWGAERASRVSLIGPVITLAAAWIILGEDLGPVELAGAAVVMAGVVALELGGRKAGAKE